MIRCLHGAAGMADDWARFGPHYHGVDLWCYLEKDDLTLEEAGQKMAQDSRPGDTLVGYSMGGRLALHALLSGACDFGEAVIISAHPGLSAGREERLVADERWARLAESDWPLFLEKWNSQPVLEGNPPQWGDRSQLAPRASEVGKSFRLWSLGAQDDLRPRLSQISCPVRWLVGEHDLKFLDLAREVIDLIPQGRLEIVPGAGHRVPWDRPDAL